MPRHSLENLRKVTLNLFEADCAAMEARYGWGWSENVREMVRNHLTGLRVQKVLTESYGDDDA